MKKLIIILSAVAMTISTANAQGISGLLKGLAGQDAAATQTADSQENPTKREGGTLHSILDMASSILGNVTVNSHFTLAGNWTYKGSAVVLTGSNTLSQLAGSAAESTMEKKVDDLLGKIGIRSGALSFTFAEDSSFTCTIAKIPVRGTWHYDAATSAVNLKFGKTMQLLSMTGIVKPVLSGETKILFEADEFLQFVKNILENAKIAASSSALSTVGTLLNSYEGLYVGLKLQK